jgi:hypothetical protein
MEILQSLRGQLQDSLDLLDKVIIFQLKSHELDL